MFQVQQYHPIEPPHLHIVRQQAQPDPMRLAFWKTKCLIQWALDRQPRYHQNKSSKVEGHLQAANEAAWKAVEAEEVWKKRDAEQHKREIRASTSTHLQKVPSERDILIHQGLKELLKDVKREEEARSALSEISTDVLAPPSEDLLEDTAKRPAIRVESDNESFLL